MKISKKDLRSKVTELINGCGRSPFLFLGSGFSRRYLGTPNWEDLLRGLCKEFSDDDFLYDRYKLKAEEKNSDEINPTIATLMEKDFREAVLDDPSLYQFRDANAEAIRSDESLLKILAADYIMRFSEKSNTDELEKLRKAGKNRISGIITTNYDCLAEELFPGFQVFIGQDDLLFQQLYEVAEIYKIHGSTTEPQSMVLDSSDYEKLQSQQDYLVAKLLTIFVEYPLIFIGYSLTDSDILGILQSLARCLSGQYLSKLKDRLIFLSRGEDDMSNRTLSFKGIGSVEMTQISTDDFGVIYEAVADSRNRFAPRVLRDLKRNIYDLVIDPEGKQAIKVTGLDGLDYISDDLEVVIGIGSPSSSTATHGHMIKAELLFYDVIDDDQYLLPNLVVEEYLPALLKSNVGLPMYKYLSLYEKPIEDPKILKHLAETKSIDSFLHVQQKKWKENFRETARELSVGSIVKNEAEGDACKKLLYLEPEEIDLGQLKDFLSRVLHSRSDVLKGNTDLRKLIRIYDFLKYKDASITAANSESLETPN